MLLVSPRSRVSFYSHCFKSFCAYPINTPPNEMLAFTSSFMKPVGVASNTDGIFPLLVLNGKLMPGAVPDPARSRLFAKVHMM